MKYWQRKKQERLYKQWAVHAELPPEAVPPLDVPDTVGVPGAVRPSGFEDEADNVSLGRDARYMIENKGWWYLLRVKIRDAVGKLLRVD